MLLLLVLVFFSYDIVTNVSLVRAVRVLVRPPDKITVGSSTRPVFAPSINREQHELSSRLSSVSFLCVSLSVYTIYVCSVTASPTDTRAAIGASHQARPFFFVCYCCDVV